MSLLWPYYVDKEDETFVLPLLTWHMPNNYLVNRFLISTTYYSKTCYANYEIIVPTKEM
jgi:hypothetical protein